jgi:hypothetical protein
MMLDVDIAESQEGDDRDDEKPRHPPEQPVDPSRGADRVVRGIVHDGEHHERHRGVDRIREPGRGPAVDVAHRGEHEGGQSAEENCDDRQRRLRHRFARIGQRMTRDGFGGVLAYVVNGRHS